MGVDLSAPKILAGAFSPSCKLLGKVKLSVKLERGPRVFLDRVARCVRDVVDECDLAWAHLRGAGVAIPGEVEGGIARAAPMLGLENFPLQAELEQRLQKPVALANECQAAAWAVYGRQLPNRPERLAAVFLERPGLVGFIVNGQLQPRPAELLAFAIPNFQTDPRAPATQNLPKQLRKAVRSGSQSARAAVAAGARQAGLLVAQTMNLLRPDLLAIDGAAIYELKEWVWPAILNEIQVRVPAPLREQVQLTICHLGKDAA